MRSKLTYANVTATLALFVALGGSSYAAIKITGKNVVDASLTTKDVKNRSLLRLDFKPGQLPAGAPGLPGTPGAKGDQGVQGLQGENGDDGAPGAAGSALAYALVSSDGSLDTSESKNVDRATKVNFGSPTTGYYCVHTTVPPKNVVATLRGSGEPGGEIKTVVSTINCATGHGPYNVQVNTFDSTGVLADRGFYVAIN